MTYFPMTEQLTEKTCGKNVSYILGKETLFAVTDYKILQNDVDDVLVKCRKLLLNGKIQLLYFTEGLQSLESAMSDQNADLLLEILKNIIDTVQKIKNNGFLKIENIVVGAKHIYIDPATLKVQFLYLPLSRNLFSEEQFFIKKLRSMLAKSLTEKGHLQEGRLQVLYENLQNTSIPLQSVLENLPPKEEKAENIEETLRLLSQDALLNYRLEINKDSYVIGRSSHFADGVILDDKRIGRTHCRIEKRQDGFVLEDLHSANGSYLNGARIIPGEFVKLKDGDILRLADICFKVEIS